MVHRKTLPALSLALLLGSVTFGTAATAAPAPRQPVAATAQRLARARLALQAALTGAQVSRQRLDQAHGAMRDIAAALDLYFHGVVPADADTRTAWAALRAEVMGVLGGAAPEIVIADDVVRFRPALHRQLATLCRELGDFRKVVEHLRAAEAVEGPRREDLNALLVAYRALGDRVGITSVEAQLRGLSPPQGHHVP